MAEGQAFDQRTDQDDRPSRRRFPTLVSATHGGARLTQLSPEAARSRSVLIVDRSDESREVLRTVLERRGVNIFEARRGAEGLEILQKQRPNVVVVDLEGDQDGSDSLESAYRDASASEETSVVMLGRVTAVSASPGGSQVISKPYHYGPLVRTIEQLLERH